MRNVCRILGDDMDERAGEPEPAEIITGHSGRTAHLLRPTLPPHEVDYFWAGHPGTTDEFGPLQVCSSQNRHRRSPVMGRAGSSAISLPLFASQAVRMFAPYSPPGRTHLISVHPMHRHGRSTP
jgi:hypothetical protein